MKLNIFNKVEMIEICPHCRSTPKKLTLLLGRAWLLLFHCRTLIWLAISYIYSILRVEERKLFPGGAQPTDENCIRKVYIAQMVTPCLFKIFLFFQTLSFVLFHVEFFCLSIQHFLLPEDGGDGGARQKTAEKLLKMDQFNNRNSIDVEGPATKPQQQQQQRKGRNFFLRLQRNDTPEIFLFLN